MVIFIRQSVIKSRLTDETVPQTENNTSTSLIFPVVVLACKTLMKAVINYSTACVTIALIRRVYWLKFVSPTGTGCGGNALLQCKARKMTVLRRNRDTIQHGICFIQMSLYLLNEICNVWKILKRNVCLWAVSFKRSAIWSLLDYQ